MQWGNCSFEVAFEKKILHPNNFMGHNQNFLFQFFSYQKLKLEGVNKIMALSQFFDPIVKSHFFDKLLRYIKTVIAENKMIEFALMQ